LEVAQVRKRVQRAIASARAGAQQRRERVADAERAYTEFLREVATPVVRQIASALKAEGYPFTVFTPGDGLRLASDRARDDFIEFSLDTDTPQPHVIGRFSHTRGSRRLDEERPLKAGAAPDQITEDDVLEFIVQALETWLAR
jgi:hypothetical protein